MKNYDAKIFLKADISQEACINLFLNWLNGSKNYKTEGLAKSYQDICGKVCSDGYKYDNENISLTLKCAVDSQGGSVAACQFINHDNVGDWMVSAVFFFTNNEVPYVLIQQECKLYDETISIEAHRPYIVTKIVDNGWIDSGAYCSFGRKQYCEKNTSEHFFRVTEEDIDEIADIMLGKGDNEIPVVYFSYDPTIGRYGASFKKMEKLAKDLAGTAYVLLDPCAVTLIDQISLKARTNKVFRGHIGIYSPGDSTVLRINPQYHKEDLIPFINSMIWGERAGYRTDRDITWKKILSVEEWDELIRIQTRENLDLRYKIHALRQVNKFLQLMKEGKRVVSFPMEKLYGKNVFLGEEYRNYVIKSLRRGLTYYTDIGSRGNHLIEKMIALNSQTEYLRDTYQEEERGMMVPFAGAEKEFEQKLRELDQTKSELEKEKYSVMAQSSQYTVESLCMICVPQDETEFFPDEFNDLILICIKKELEIASAREKVMLEEVLAYNKMCSFGRKKMDQIAETIKRSNPWSASIERELERLGFVFEPFSKHHRAYYKDPRYNVIFSSTASDFRAGENTASDIMKKISIYTTD